MRELLSVPDNLLERIHDQRKRADNKGVWLHVHSVQATAVEVAREALQEHNIERDQAAFIKKEFDKRYGPTWHCIVGRHFGSYITHETKHFIYFYLDQVCMMM